MSSSAEPNSDFADRPWMAGAEMPPRRPTARPALSDRGWLVACHLGPLVLWLLYPYGAAALVPLLIWQIKAKQDKNERLASHAIESLNFQLNLTLLSAALTITIIGVLFLPVLMVVGLVLTIKASYRTSKGEDFRYPWIYRLIKEEPLVEDPPAA